MTTPTRGRAKSAPANARADGLVVVHVRDQVNSDLAGHGGCQYTSPPQPAEQARALVAVLLGCPAHAIDAQHSWTRPIAGGRRTITLAPA